VCVCVCVCVCERERERERETGDESLPSEATNAQKKVGSSNKCTQKKRAKRENWQPFWFLLPPGFRGAQLRATGDTLLSYTDLRVRIGPELEAAQARVSYRRLNPIRGDYHRWRREGGTVTTPHTPFREASSSKPRFVRALCYWVASARQRRRLDSCDALSSALAASLSRALAASGGEYLLLDSPGRFARQARGAASSFVCCASCRLQDSAWAVR